MLSKEYVMKILEDGGYIETCLREVKGTKEDWLGVIKNSPNEMRGVISREKAAFWNRRVIERISLALENDPNAIITSSNQTKFFTFNDQINMRCKKLDNFMRAMSIKTQRVKDIWYENDPPLPGLLDNWINITLGWHMDKIGNLDDIAIICEYQDQLQWAIFINEDGERFDLPVQPALPGMPPAEGYVAKVRPDSERAKRIAKEKQAKDAKDEAT